jgi:hypothetical protein
LLRINGGSEELIEIVVVGVELSALPSIAKSRLGNM